MGTGYKVRKIKKTKRIMRRIEVVNVETGELLVFRNRSKKDALRVARNQYGKKQDWRIYK